MKNPIPRYWRSLLLFFFIVFAVGFLGNLVTMPQIPTWYTGLRKAPWNPPAWVFGPVWTILYIMIALAGWRLWTHLPLPDRDKVKTPVIRAYIVQLFLNFIWSPVFFGMHEAALAFGVIVFLIIAIVVLLFYARRTDRIAFWMLIPYLLWVCYASTLNGAIVLMN